jgi:DNA-binding beta-propeller fold protein YncE
MKLKPLAILTVLVTLSLFPIPSYAAPQKKKAAKKEAAANPDAAPTAGAKDPANPAAKPAAKEDPARDAWRIEVEPYAIFGSGRPGKGAADFDKPDGVAFAPNGWLLATDAKNRRVQVWDVKAKTHLGEFGHGIFGGEIVDIAISPNGMALITDQTLNLAYAFIPANPGATEGAAKGKSFNYQFKGTRFGEQGFDKLGGVAVDSRGRIYGVDAHLNDVRRYNSDGTVDASWKFDKKRADGDTYLHGCEGIAIDEANGNLFVASEKDSIIQVFDWETGKHKGRLVGAVGDASGKPSGQSVFSGSVEGLAIAGNYLFAVDESVGRIQIFDLSNPKAFNTDLAGFGATAKSRDGGYKGFFGHGPLVDFEDKNNKALQQQVKLGAVIPGQANPPGYFCSPDSIATYADKESGEIYIAIADQCNYRLAVYRWSDINKALGPTVAKNTATPAAAGGGADLPAKGEKPGHKKGKKKH